MSEKTSVIIVHKNEHEYLNLYLQSIFVCSKNNDYEIIIVDNNSNQEKSKNFLNKIQNYKNIKVVFEEEDKSYSNCILSGYNQSDLNSDYLIFSHSDNLILNHTWLDFMILSFFKNKDYGIMSVGPQMTFSGPSGEKEECPNYNFIFTTRQLFEDIKSNNKLFKTNNVGFILSYFNEMKRRSKKSIMISPLGFLHHYQKKSISHEEKINDIQRFYQLLINLPETKSL
ncbi:MAG: glycosyltransferase [Bacillota bacterium]